MKEMDHVAPNAKLSHHNARLYNFEDNEAVIKMIIKGSPTMRHVSHTFGALDWFHRINLDPMVQVRYDTRGQLTDLTKGFLYS